MAKTIRAAVRNFRPKLEVYKESHLEHIPNPALAESISGSSDKQSKAYRSALRNVQRWKKGTQAPNSASRKKVVEYIKHRPKLARELFKPDKDVRVAVHAWDPYDQRFRTFSIKLNPSAAVDFFGMEEQDAREHFFEEYGYTPYSLEKEQWSVYYDEA